MSQRVPSRSEPPLPPAFPHFLMLSWLALLLSVLLSVQTSCTSTKLYKLSFNYSVMYLYFSVCLGCLCWKQALAVIYLHLYPVPNKWWPLYKCLLKWTEGERDWETWGTTAEGLEGWTVNTRMKRRKLKKLKETELSEKTRLINEDWRPPRNGNQKTLLLRRIFQADRSGVINEWKVDPRVGENPH